MLRLARSSNALRHTLSKRFSGGPPSAAKRNAPNPPPVKFENVPKESAQQKISETLFTKKIKGPPLSLKKFRLPKLSSGSFKPPTFASAMKPPSFTQAILNKTESSASGFVQLENRFHKTKWDHDWFEKESSTRGPIKFDMFKSEKGITFMKLLNQALNLWLLYIFLKWIGVIDSEKPDTNEATASQDEDQPIGSRFRKLREAESSAEPSNPYGTQTYSTTATKASNDYDSHDSRRSQDTYSTYNRRDHHDAHHQQSSDSGWK